MAVLVLLLVGAVQAFEPVTITINIETEALDLDTGTVVVVLDQIEPSDVDIQLAFNALRSPRLRAHRN